MTNWEKILQNNVLNAIGIGAYELNKDNFKWLKKETVRAKKKAIKNNKQLIGHIKEEYLISQCEESFESFLIECLKNPRHQGTLKNNKYDLFLNKKSGFIKLDSMWVNYQKKYEFNPLHDHSGVFSFVIFVKIPYDLKKEDNYFNELDKTKQQVHNSRLCFVNTKADGEIHSTAIDVDKSFEGKMFLFPSIQQHLVYPFYTSNDYRITISGNLKFKL